MTPQLDAPSLEGWLGSGHRIPPQHDPHVTAAVSAWLDEGAREPVAALARRLWASTAAQAIPDCDAAVTG